MRKDSFAIVLLAVLNSQLSCSPSIADDASTLSSGNSSVPIKSSPPGSTKSSSGLSRFSRHFFGVVAGAVVGVPVNVVRRTVTDEKYGISDMIGPGSTTASTDSQTTQTGPPSLPGMGDSHSGRVTVPASILYAPFAAMAAVIEAPFFAAKNALVNIDQPFSKEQLSLRERKQSPKQIEKDMNSGTSER